MYSKSIVIWWLTLTVISIFNVAYIFCTSILNTRADLQLPIFLAMLYTIVCAIRAIWPRLDIEQQCLFDHRISTPFVGRTMATFAELAFIVLVIYFMNYVLTITKLKNENYDFIFIAIFAMIVIAQIFCWIGVTSKRPMWNALEESLWTLSMILILVVLGIVLSNMPNDNFLRNYLVIYGIILLLYVAFMIVRDIPLYISKAQTKYRPRSMLSLQSYIDLNKCTTIDWSYDAWKMDIPWLSGYFTGAVWLTFSMIHVMQRSTS